jgi:hypothetical protein
MGLYKGEVQSIFAGSYILPSADEKKKRDQRIKGEGTNKKEKEGKKVIYQEAQCTSPWTRGLKS